MSEDTTLAQLEGQLDNSTQMGPDLAASVYHNANSQENNLIVWQLELDNILERIEHLLKGETVHIDRDGNITYKTAKDDDLRVLNEYGVALIMNKMSFYLNRNTILSNYDETRIYEILCDIGEELADLMFINYEKMGLNTVEKKARYEPLVMTMLHIIESAYNRALQGAERESLRSARVVTQTQPIVNPNMPVQPQKRGFSLNPFKAFRR